LVALASKVPGWLGGRLTGGGFGGMTVHLVGRRAAVRFIAALPPESAATRCGLGGGATRIEL
jgi:galactokinase